MSSLLIEFCELKSDELKCSVGIMPEINYEELRRIYLLEKNSSSLIEVDVDFYASLRSFVDLEKDKYVKSLNSLSGNKAKDFGNVKHMVEEIYAMREKKIMNKALSSARNQETDETNMVQLEKELYRALMVNLQKPRSIIDDWFALHSETEGVKLKIIQEVPEFIGPDLKNYGPYQVNQTVSLSKKIADLFLQRKMAVPLELTSEA